MKTLTHEELTALREDDFELDMAMASAMENALDLGLEDDDEVAAEQVRQVNGWIDSGREW